MNFFRKIFKRNSLIGLIVAVLLVSLELLLGGGELKIVKKQVKSYITESDSLNNYFGKIEKVSIGSIAVNGDKFDRFPGKSKVYAYIKGIKKQESVLFILTLLEDDSWVVSEFEIQE